MRELRGAMHYKSYKKILSPNNGMNIYRGCTHGCIYCDSRSTCYQMNHDFEDVEIKTEAPKILMDQLIRKRKKCMIGTGAMCDPYIHLEEELEYTRRCLEIIYDLGFGLAIQTKSDRILRDLDLLKKINEKTKCVVQVTMTTYDEELCKIIEPNVSTTKERFEILRVMNENGIATIVWICPILPFINDSIENLDGILNYCIEARVYGIICFGFGVTLRDGNREYFYDKLDKYSPELKKKYIQIFGNSYECRSPNHKILMQYFKEKCKKHNIITDANELFQYMHKFEEKESFFQLKFF